jgi:3-oxoadipate enol-lactonase
MRDCEAKRNMTNSGPEKHRPNNEEDLPVVLLHGTPGQSEDWSQTVEQLTSHRPVIRLNYAEPVASTDSANAPRVSAFADRVVAAAEAGGRHRFDFVGDPLNKEFGIHHRV